MKKQINLYSKDPKIKLQLEELQKGSKRYDRLLEAMSILGNFDKKVEVELYETINNNHGQKDLIYCSDLDSNIFILFGNSTDKKDYTILRRITNLEDRKYDIALAKKFELNSDNIELIEADKVLDFKYGRLVTDEKDFYTIFLSEDVSYKICFKDLNVGISANSILKELNSFDKELNLKDYLDIFHLFIVEQDLYYEKLIAKAYKKFNFIGGLTIDGNKTDVKVLQKNEDTKK